MRAGKAEGSYVNIMRDIAINATITIVTVCLCLIIGEVGLRCFTSFGPRSGYLEPETTFTTMLTPRTHVFKPNYRGMLKSRDFEVPYNLNSLGFRERELDFEKLKPQRPYLFLGDSFFHGWGVHRKDRISELFSKDLRSKGINVPVVNMAFPGFGAYQYLDIAKIYSEKISPRLIVIGFFVGNDFIDDLNTLKAAKSSVVKKSGKGFWFFYKAKKVLRGFLRTSPTINLVKSSLWNIKAFRYIFNKLSIENDRIALYKKESSTLQNDFYSATFSAFDELAEFSRTSNIPIIVVIIPDNLQIMEPKLFAEYDYKKPQKMLASHLDKLKIPYLDLLDKFLSIKNPKSLHFREDKHWNEKGHSTAEKLLFAYMQSGQKL